MRQKAELQVKKKSEALDSHQKGLGGLSRALSDITEGIKESRVPEEELEALLKDGKVEAAYELIHGLIGQVHQHFTYSFDLQKKRKRVFVEAAEKEKVALEAKLAEKSDRIKTLQ